MRSAHARRPRTPPTDSAHIQRPRTAPTHTAAHAQPHAQNPHPVQCVLWAQPVPSRLVLRRTNAAQVTTASLDWSADAATMAKMVGLENSRDAAEGSFDVIIGADILYDAQAATLLAKLLDTLLPPAPLFARVLLADPGQRPHRDAFAKACSATGLVMSDDVLPGPEDMRLVGVMRAEFSE